MKRRKRENDEEINGEMTVREGAWLPGMTPRVQLRRTRANLVGIARAVFLKRCALEGTQVCPKIKENLICLYFKNLYDFHIF